MRLEDFKDFIIRANENYPFAAREIAQFERSMDDQIKSIHEAAANQAVYGRGISATEHVQNLLSEKVNYLKTEIREAYKREEMDLPENDLFKEVENQSIIKEIDNSKGKDVSASEKFSSTLKYNQMFDENTRSIDHPTKGDFRISANSIKDKNIELDKD